MSSKAKPTTGESDTHEFPEGGRGWLVIAGTWVIMAASFGLVSSYGVYQAYYLEVFPSTPQSVLTLIGSLQPFMIYSSGIPAVALIRRYGAQVVVALSGALLVLSLMMIPLCKQVWQLFLAQGVLFGFGSGLGVFVSYSVPQQWFKRRRALAVGLAASGSSVGGLAWPIVLQALQNRVGFAWTNRIMGFIFIPMMIFAAFAMKERSMTAPSAGGGADAEQAVTEVINVGEQEKAVVSMLEEAPTPAAPPLRSRRGKYLRNPFGFIDWSVINDFHFGLILATNALVFLGFFPGLFFLPSFVKRIDTSHTISKYALTICNSASVAGRIVPGFMGDRIGRLNTLIPSILLVGVCQFAFWLPARGDALIVLFAITYGYSTGAIVSLFPACLGQLFGIHSLQSRLCIMFLFGAPSSLLGPALCGLFLPLPSEPGIHGYNKLVIFCGVMCLSGAAVLCACRISISRKLLSFV